MIALRVPGAMLRINTVAAGNLPCRTLHWAPGQGAWVRCTSIRAESALAIQRCTSERRLKHDHAR